MARLPMTDPSPPPSETRQLGEDLDSSADTETAHLDAIDLGELEGDPAAPADATGLPLAAGGFLSAEAWQGGLRHALSLGGHMTGLRTLLASPDAPTFPDAAQAMYDSILACPPLHFLIRPGGLWIQRAAAVMVWAVPIGAGVRAELAERRASRSSRSSSSSSSDHLAEQAAPAAA